MLNLAVTNANSRKYLANHPLPAFVLMASMKAKVIATTCSVLYAATLGFAQNTPTDPVSAPPSAPQTAIAPAVPATPIDPLPAVDPVPVISETHVNATDETTPNKPRHRVRIERQGSGRKVQMDERDENISDDRESSKQRFAFIENDDADHPEAPRPPRPPKERRMKDETVIARKFEKDRNLHPDFAFSFTPQPDDRKARPDRIEHLEEAIQHLRKAGLDDLANGAQARLDKMRAEALPFDNHLREELDHLRQEHEKLQQELRKLQNRLREMKPETGVSQ